jgi:hypothetical protein
VNKPFDLKYLSHFVSTEQSVRSPSSNDTPKRVNRKYDIGIYSTYRYIHIS